MKTNRTEISNHQLSAVANWSPQARMQYEAQRVMAAPTPNLLGLGSWPLTLGLGPKSQFGVHSTQRQADHSSATMKLFLDPKASGMYTSDLCVLHINCITTTCLYICYWSWNTAGVNQFHPALAKFYELMPQNKRKKMVRMSNGNDCMGTALRCQDLSLSL